MKRTLSILLSVLLLLTMLPLGAVNVSAYAWHGDFLYETQNGNAIISAYFGSSSNIEIPSNISGYPVAELASSLFSGNTTLQSVTLPDSLIKIGSTAFYGCTNLTNIDFGDGVEVIGEFAFADCTGLTEIDLGGSLTSIEQYAFINCSNLKKVTLPATIFAIYTCAFANCTSLTDVYYDGTAADRNGIYIASYNTDFSYATWHYATLPSEVYYTIENNEVTIEGCNYAFAGEMVIPAKVNGYPVTTIAEGAFNSCFYMTSLILPDTVKTIGEGAFIGCNSLTSIDMGDGVTTLGPYTFTYCSNLTEVIFSESLAIISDGAFYGCTGLTEIDLPVSLKIIGNTAFYLCNNLKKVNYAGSVSDKNLINIGYSNTELTNATWTYAGCDHYYYSSVTTTATCVSSGVRTYTCYYCNSSYTETIYATGIHTYDNGCDAYCNICGGWRSVSHSYNDSNSIACNNCGEVRYITYSISGGEVTITGCNTTFSGQMVIPDTISGYPVTAIGSWAFDSCTSLTSIVIPDSVTRIGSYAFNQCTSLASVSTLNNVTTISEGAFYYCSSLQSLPLGNDVTTIGAWAFALCQSLPYINLPDTVTNIGQGAFMGCFNAYWADLGDGMITIGEQALSDCIFLQSLTIGDRVTSIGDKAFFNCIYLYDVYYGGSLSGHNTIVIGSDNAPLFDATWHYAICDHAYIAETTAPDCRNNGYTTYTCVNCGDSYTDDVVPATGNHIYDNACDADCNICGAMRGYADIVFDDVAKRTVLSLTCQEWTQNGIVVTNNKHEALSNVADYANPARFYRDSQLIITYTNMTQIIFNCHSATYAKSLAQAIGEEAIIDGETQVIVWLGGVDTFSCDLTAGQVRIDSIVVQGGTIPAHIYDTTCDAYCNVCGAVREVEPHPYTSVVTTAPTCTADGVRTFTCATCGDTYTESIAALGHIPGAAADCLNDQTCTVCGAVLTEALGHDYKSVVTAPTCVADGYATHTCTRCGDTYVDSTVAAIGHSYTSAVTTAPTCGAEGVTTYTCTCCDDTYTESIPATGAHTYNTACDADCNVCGFTRVPSDHVYDDEYDPTCNTCGAVRDVPEKPAEILYGDVNNDGDINVRDYGLLQQYLNDYDVTINLDAADVNGDGDVNVRDYGLLQQFLNDYDVTLGG